MTDRRSRQSLVTLVSALLAIILVTPIGSPAAPVARATLAGPVITAPAPGGSVSATPVFGWSPVSGATAFRVEIAGAAGFVDPLLTRTTVNRWLTTADALPGGEISWRVAALGSDGTQGPWATASFTNLAALAAPVLTPAVVVAPYPATPPVIAWDPVPGAAGYDLRMDVDPASLPTDLGLRGARAPLRGPAGRGWRARQRSPIYWQVRARGAGGLAFSPWSEVGELRTSWPDAPTPTTPDGASGIEMDLDWEPLPGASRYTIEVEKVGTGESPIEAGTEATRYRFDRYLGGEYRWRVRGQFNTGSSSVEGFFSPWSGWRTYAVASAPEPNLLEPSDGAVVPGHVRLAWQPVTYAFRYRVEVSADSTFATGVVAFDTGDTAIEPGTFRDLYDQVQAPLSLADGSTYYWRVRPQLRPYIGTGWSAVRSFTVDAAPLTLLEPAGGATVEIPTFTWERGGDTRFEITIRDGDGAVVDHVVTQAARYTAAAAARSRGRAVHLGRRGARLGRRRAGAAQERRSVVRPRPAGRNRDRAGDPRIPRPGPRISCSGGRPSPAPRRTTSSQRGPTATTTPPTNADPLPYPELVHVGPWVSGPDRWSPEPAGYTYRVIAYDANGVELVRGPPRSLPAPLPAAPELLGPADCATADCGTNASPIFRWEPVAGALFYQVDHQSAGPTPTTTGTSARAFYPRPSDTEALAWRVRAIGSAGAGPWSATRGYWWSRVYPTPVGPAEGATVEDEVTLSYEGGTAPSAPPGEEPAWTVQEQRLVNRPAQSYVASQEPYALSWGLFDDGAPRRTLTIQRSVPALLGPADGAVVDPSPLLRWTPQPWVKGYAVEIHRGGSDPLSAATLLATIGTRDASAVAGTALAPGTYRWRVRRTELAGYPEAPMPGSPWSEPGIFSVPSVPGPVLAGPVDGATLVAGDMLLAWEPVAGASAYRVELSRDPAFAVLGYTASSAAPGWAPGAPLSGGTWHWRVQAVGLGDTVIGTSAGRSFTLDAPLQKPPTGQLVAGGGQAFVAWPTTTVAFPTAAFLGARRVRLSNDMVTWRTYAWRPSDYTWDLAPGAVSGQPGSTTAPAGPYTVYGQWEDLDGNWSAVASDTVVFDNVDPTATVSLDGGAATTTSRFVQLEVRPADNDLVGPIVICDGVRCATLTGVTGPISWRIAGDGDPPGVREVCAWVYDGARNDAPPVCDTIELVEPASDDGGTASPAGSPVTLPLQLAPTGLLVTHVRAGDELTVEPFTGPGGLPGGTATCTWELRWGDHAALRDGAANGSGGGVTTSGTAAEGFCDAWRFRIPSVAAGLFTIGYTARAADGAILATTPTDWPTRPKLYVPGDAAVPPALTESSLPVVALGVEGPDVPGEPLTYSATPLGFSPTDATLTARSPTGSVVTAADGRSLTVTAPDEGRWSVRWSGHRGTHLVTAYLDPTITMLDATAPRTTAPLARPNPGHSIGSSLAVLVSWSGTDVGSGIDRYELQVSRNGGAWSTVRLPASTSRWVGVSMALSGSYRYRVHAIDRAGNAGAWTTGPLLRPSLAADSTASVRGRWYRSWWSGYLGGSTRWATARNASATYTFTGSAIGWVSRAGPTRGRATVYVDGHVSGTIDLRASRYGNRRLVFSQAWPSVGRHTIKIVVAGTAGHPRVDVDGFVVLR